MSTLRKEAEQKGKAVNKDEIRKDTTLPPGEASTVEEMAVVLTKLHNLRRQHSEASQDTKATLSRVHLLFTSKRS